MNNNKKIITLNLSGCKYLGEIHDRIRLAFDFPEWYGQNSDAFWDLINEPRENTFVEISGLASLPDELMQYVQHIIDLLEENKLWYKKFAQENDAPDLIFDYIISD